MAEHKKVWLDKGGDVWSEPPTAHGEELYGPFTERKVVSLDATVVEHDELPEVTKGGDGMLRTVHGTASANMSASWHRDLALHHLAMAEHAEANPPVDQAEVYRLVTAFHAAGGRLSGASFEQLVRAGVRAPEATL